MQEVVEELRWSLSSSSPEKIPAIRVTERARVVERARVGLAVDGDLRVVDVASQFGLVLVLLVLRFERLDALAVVLVGDQANDLDVVFKHLLEVVVVVGEETIHVELARGVERLVVVDGVGRVDPLVEVRDDAFALVERQEHEGVLVHRGLRTTSSAGSWSATTSQRLVHRKVYIRPSSRSV